MAADTALGPFARPGNIRLGRATALVTVLSAGLHLAGIADHDPVQGILLAVMACACIGCVPALWKRPSANTFALVAVMSSAMLAVHSTMLASAQHGHSQHGAPANGPSLDFSTALTLYVALFEAALAIVAVFLTTRADPAELRLRRRVPDRPPHLEGGVRAA